MNPVISVVGRIGAKSLIWSDTLRSGDTVAGSPVISGRVWQQDNPVTDQRHHDLLRLFAPTVPPCLA